MRRSTSIHWHGLFQHRTASEDGPAMVNQCPIAPGHAYTYDIPLNGQSGTFWYHSHLSTQYVDGLRGALVVYDDEDPNRSLYDVDDATTQIGITGLLLLCKMPISLPTMAEARNPFLTLDLSTVSAASKRYRLRVINISGFAQFRFSIEGHSLTIIEADGIPHEPLTVDSFNIYVAQRYSVVITANQPVANYWIRAPLTVSGASSNKNLDPTNVYAILRYAGAPNADPTTAAKAANGGVLLQEQNLHAINLPVPGGSAPADRTIDLSFTKSTDALGAVQWTINGIKYLPSDLPTLLNIIANNFTVESDFTTSEHTFVLNRNDVIELVIHGSLNGITHPFHLHGHAFHVIQSSDGGAPNFVNPPVRDVIGVGGSGVRIRFRADNPGPWFLHCHIDWHLEAGLAVVFAEAPQDQRTGPDAQIIKPTWVDLCTIYKNLPADQQ
ncbi:multicopper oxidase [Sphaerobolus stellatus SS14]|nr:multicopper oxidase [Sphaerobolus stellatus SS14]